MRGLYGVISLEAKTGTGLGVISFESAQLAFSRFHQTNLKQWYRLLQSQSSFLNPQKYEPIALTLLELCSDCTPRRIPARAQLLTIILSHRQLANLVGASQPRVTEHLARLEAVNVWFFVREPSTVVRADRLEKM